jgi:hypothetical protein
MRAVLFEGTPEELVRVEAMFRAGDDPTCRPGQLSSRAPGRGPDGGTHLAIAAAVVAVGFR